MKKITFLYKSLLVILALISFQGFSQNLLVNGGFESGGSGTGFQTNYFLPGTAGTSAPRDYSVLADPFTMNTANFAHATDHTTGAGKMLVVDGSGNGGDKIWELLNGSSIGVVSGRTYTFSYWIRSISGTNTLANSAIIAVNTNGTTSAPVLTLGPATCPTGNPSAWTQVTYTWTATTNNAQIWITDTQTVGGGIGNDFALDDFSLVAVPLPLSLSHSFTNESCANYSNGTITAYANNGVPPYVTYNLTGAVTQNNATGVFTGLAPGGNYNLSVTDSAGTTVIIFNIIIGTGAALTTSNDVIICRGSSTTLSVSGGSTGYNWTASPADPSLTATTSATPTVSPTVTTLYTASSTKNTVLDLITNGNFSNGNVGFDSDYNYFNPSNLTFVQKAYGVVTNPNIWESGFSALCVDHTSATGQMMVIDGSTTNAGNDLVWGQTMPVTAGQNYTFSFFAQSLTNSNASSIRVVINGVTVGTLNLTTTICSWNQFPPFVWNSGASTSAQVQLFDTNISSVGNDFAIDDITFTTNIVCNILANVQVDVNVCAATTCPTPVVSVTQQPTCAVPTGTIVFTSPLNVCPLTQPTDLFISEVTDENVGSLTYVEIFNGTGTTKNLANYRLKIYNNGSAVASCDLLLSGSLPTNSVVVVGVGSVVNQGAVIPNLVFAACGGVNIDDNIRLTTSGNVEVDLWGRTDGVAFTPANQPGYTYRRNVCATHPSLTWSLADWTALDPQDYTNVGSYQMSIYEYSVNGTTYQTSPTFTGLVPNVYNVTIRDLISGCISTPIPLTINPIPTPPPPAVNPITYCQNATAVPLTATPSAGGTLNWYATASSLPALATAPTPPTTGAVGSVVHYYVSQTIGGCESPRADIAVTIGNVVPTSPPFLFCDTLSPNTTATSVNFDFNNAGQTNFSYSYTIDGGSPITGYKIEFTSITQAEI